jgi:hypothetical protein
MMETWVTSTSRRAVAIEHLHAAPAGIARLDVDGERVAVRPCSFMAESR